MASANNTQEKIFETLKQRALRDDVSLNYSDLRESYTNTTSYRPYTSGERTRVTEIFSLINKQQYQKCLKRTDELLERVFISLGAHYTSVICAKGLQDEEKAYLHEQILEGLLDSILKSGDGKSTQTAFVTYSSDELYTFLHLSGLQAKGQGVVNKEGKVFDAMQVIQANDENSEEFTLYFDITTQWSKGFSRLK